MSDSADRPAEASIEHLLRLFTVPEAADSTLARIERALTANLAEFLGDHVVATARSLAEIEADFADTRLPEAPTFVSDQADFLLDKVVAESVHTAAPGFVGHMTTALPYFMLPLTKLLTGLNQNLVKTETSKAFTPLERQVLGMLHRLVYARDDAFYAARLHDPAHALGAFGSGGTVANLTALWVARNRAFPATGEFPGVARAGFAAATTRWPRPPTSSASVATSWSRWRPIAMTGYARMPSPGRVAIGRPEATGCWRSSASPAPPRPAVSTRSMPWPTSPPTTAPTSMSMPPGVGRRCSRRVTAAALPASPGPTR
jgi:hypothetical protein